jgi:hypothetical protein
MQDSITAMTKDLAARMPMLLQLCFVCHSVEPGRCQAVMLSARFNLAVRARTKGFLGLKLVPCVQLQPTGCLNPGRSAQLRAELAHRRSKMVRRTVVKRRTLPLSQQLGTVAYQGCCMVWRQQMLAGSTGYRLRSVAPCCTLFALLQQARSRNTSTHSAAQALRSGQRQSSP